MSWGSQLGYLEALRDDLGILPLGLANRPELYPEGQSLNAAFNTLSSSRHYNDNGALAISITEMYSFCQLFEITNLDERLEFIATIQKLDGAYLAEVAKRAASKTKVEVVDSPPVA